jgi:hypothetical protein
MDLKPLIVLTGTLHVEGGLAKTTRSKAERANVLTVTEKREVSPDRRRGNVVVTDVMRRIRQIRIVRTPFGTLIDPEQLEALKTVITEASKAVTDFNAKAGNAILANTLLWEPLDGNRLVAVQGWVRKHQRELKDVLPALTVRGAKAA